MLIAFTGFKGAGKSTAARYAALHLGHAVVLPFAEPLKSMLSSLGLTWAQVYGNEKEIPIPWLGDVTPRSMMQALGTEWGRRLHPDLWVQLWGRKYKKLREMGKENVIVDDLRFLNEERAVFARGGLVVRVVREGCSAGEHLSETEQCEVVADEEIKNNGSLVDLHHQVEDILGHFDE